MSGALVLVMVGTHHRPFARLVEWADRLAEEGHDVLVQYGTSPAPRLARGVPSLTRAQMDAYSPRVGALVCQGGPSLIMEWLRRSHLPIVVPRDPVLGEHIDQHQQLFADFMLQRGWVRRADDYAGLRAALALCLTEGDDTGGITLPDTAAAVDAFATLASATAAARGRG